MYKYVISNGGKLISRLTWNHDNANLERLFINFKYDILDILIDRNTCYMFYILTGLCINIQSRQWRVLEIK